MRRGILWFKRTSSLVKDPINSDADALRPLEAIIISSLPEYSAKKRACEGASQPFSIGSQVQSRGKSSSSLLLFQSFLELSRKSFLSSRSADDFSHALERELRPQGSLGLSTKSRSGKVLGDFSWKIASKHHTILGSMGVRRND